VLRLAPPTPFKLIDLPQQYTDALRRWGRAPCSLCGAMPRSPSGALRCVLCAAMMTSHCDCAVCLFTGAVVCPASACSAAHVDRYGAGSGVFLSVNSCEVVVLLRGLIGVLHTPYLDEFGDEDIQRECARFAPHFVH
jgi:hypothetical protein